METKFTGQALGWHVVIEDIEPKITKTSSGLELTDKHRDDIRYRQGRIISVGEELKDKVKIGDRVLYDKAAGNNFETDEGEILKVVQAHDLKVIL